MECPYCKGNNTTEFCGKFLCKECDRIFDDEDIIREDIRHRLSAILADYEATEENPMPFDYPIGEWDEETLGLSTLDLPWSKSIFEAQDGTIWFNLDYSDSEPMDFDDICTKDLQDIIEEIEKRD